MKSPLSYILKVLLFTALILAPALLAFRLLDPFKMHGFYDNYIYPSPTANKGMVSLRNFTRYDPVRHFDSFITGSSVSCNYLVEDWQRHIGTQSRPFHFDSSGQTITSLRRTVEYLDSHISADSLRNMLIVLSPLSFVQPDPRRPFLDPPEINPGIISILDWHYKAFRSFTDCNFLVSYLHWLADGNPRERSRHNVFYGPHIRLIPEINEERLDIWEDSIDSYPAEFFTRHPIPAVAAADTITPEPMISPKQASDLRAVAAILERRRCHTRIIFPPNRRGILLHPADDSLMNSIFGSAFVNLGSELRTMKADSCNFYDNVHYRPRMALRIMELVYAGNSSGNQTPRQHDSTP